MMRAVALLLFLLAAPAEARTRSADTPPTGEIVLDLDAPIVEATIGGIPLRLAVTLDGRDMVQLNPDAAARLPLAFEEAGEIEVGRVILHGRQARAEGVVGGKRVTLVVTTNERTCCTGVDGSIGPDQMPFARIRYVRASGSHALARRYPATVTPEAGLAIVERVGDGSVSIKLAPEAVDTIATGAAGAILARAGGGAWAGEKRAVPVAFDMVRPARLMRFETSPVLLGFAISGMMVRTADFRGGRALPVDAATPSDILVRGHGRASQHEWRAVTLGRAQLDRCEEIIVERVPTLMVEMHCGEDGR